MSSAAFVLAGRQDCPPDPVVHSSQPPMAWPFRLWSVKPSREAKLIWFSFLYRKLNSRQSLQLKTATFPAIGIEWLIIAA